MKSFVLFSILIFMCGCSSVSKPTSCGSAPEVVVGGEASLCLPKPAEFSAPRKVVQVLTFEYEGKSYTSEVVLEISNKELVLNAVSPLWPSALKASYDGNEFKVDKRLRQALPIDFKYIVADIVLVFGTSQDLAKWLLSPAKLQNGIKSRSISVGDQRIVQISYDSKLPWTGTAELENSVRKYKVKIK